MLQLSRGLRPWALEVANEVKLQLPPALTLKRLAFVRSGYVAVYYGQARNFGENGYGWSRTSQSSTHAYNLNFNPSDVNPSNNSNRFNGFPLR